MKIDGKRVVVTGGSTGIGLAIARRLLEGGAVVTISARHEDDLVAAAADLGAIGTVHHVAADVATDEGRQATLDMARSAMGGLDILVNNAGVVRAGRLEETGIDAIRQMIEVDLAAPILLTRLAIPDLRRSGEALIVNISSGIALVGQPFYAVYAAAKAGLANFGEALRRELNGEGVGVLTVYPMATDTPMMKTAEREPDGGYDAPEDVAAATVEAIERGALRVIRGGEKRRKAMIRTVEDPGAIDAQLLPEKDRMEREARNHSSL